MSNMIFYLLAGGIGGLIGLWWLFIYRSVSHGVYQLKMIDRIALLVEEDIRLGLPWKWRYDEFSKPQPKHMILYFWRPIASFYINHPCLGRRTTVNKTP